MTAQLPDILINEHPRVDLKQLKLYFVVRPEDQAEDRDFYEYPPNLPVLPKIPKDNYLSTDLWRRYVATFRLLADGTFELIAYDFPYTQWPAPTQHVSNGKLQGNFGLVMRNYFSGPNTNIPFRDGRIVEDRTKWVIEDQSLHGQVLKNLKDSGLLVDIDDLGSCFMPRSLLPPDLAVDLNALVGRNVTCEYDYEDEKRRVVIVRPLKFQ